MEKTVTMEQTLPVGMERYQLRKKLGEGGMGEVYLASDTLLKRDVAIKLVHHKRLPDDSDARRLFRREARATARLEHPGIVRIYDFLEREDHDYIVMEHLEGTTLAESLAGVPLRPERALPLFRDVADSLAHAHEKGILHRDLKPGNIWITPEGKVKLLDFGLAKQLEDDESTLMDGKIVGTVSYMSPEQALGKKLDRRSDLFSFGVVLYEALTGETPFRGQTPTESLAKIITEQHVPAVERNPEVPQRISDLIDALLAKDPDRRPGSAEEVAAILGSPEARPSKVKPWVKAVAAVVFLVLVLAGIAVMTSRDSMRPSIAVLAVSDGPPEEAWTATALVEILNAHLEAGDELRVVDGYHTVLVPMPKDLGERLTEEELAALVQQLRVDHFVLGTTDLDGADLRVRLGLYRSSNGRRLAEYSTTSEPLGLADSLVDVAAGVRRELDLAPLGSRELAAVRAAFPPREAGREYARGLYALRTYDPGAARDHLKAAIAAAPEHPMPQAVMARTQVQLGNLDPGYEAAAAAQELGGGLSERQQLLLKAARAEAEPNWPEAARLRQQLWDEHRDDFTAGLDLADALLALSRMDEVKALLAELAPASVTLVDDGYFNFVTARTDFLFGDFHGARAAAQSAVETSEKSGARQLGAKALLLQAIALDLIGRPQAAHDALKEARGQFHLIDNLNGLFDGFSQHVVTLVKQGKIGEAQREFKKYRDEIYHDGDHYQEALMANNLGYVLADQGDLDSATAQYEEAAKIFKENNWLRDAAMVLVNLGASEEICGRLEKARQHYEQARDFFLEKGDRGNLAYALTNLGGLRFWAGDFDGALKLHRQALAINRDLEDRSGAAWDTYRIAEALRRQGAFEEAFEHYEEALAEQEELGELGAETRIGLAWLEIARQNFGDALAHARETVRLMRDAGYCGDVRKTEAGKEGDSEDCPVDLVVRAQIVEAEVFLRRPERDLKRARELLAKAQLRSGETKDRRVQFETRRLAVRLLDLDGNHEAAAEAAKRLAEEAEVGGFVVFAKDARELLSTVVTNP